MKNISITVENKRATVVGGPVIVCGNSDYTVTFAFDDEWSLTGPKTARFVYVKRGKVEHEDKVFEGNTVAVPVLSDVAFVNVGVFAGDLCTTTPARVNCKASILCSSGAVHEPTPDVYSQIMALFNEMAEKGAFGATEEQMQLVEQNRRNIEQNRQSIEQHGQSIEQHGQNIEDVTDRVAELEDGTMQAGNASKLGGHKPSYFATAKSVTDITDGTTPAGKAEDSNTLGGHEANYFFPKSGGYITGAEFGIGSANAESGYTFGLKNAKRFITEQILPDGTYRIRDTNNDKAIIKSNVDGTTTFEGTASGNVPITGGTMKGLLDFKRNNEAVGYGRIYQDNYAEKNFGLTLRDYADSTNFVGVRICYEADKIFYRAKDKVEKELLHTGNSAKVHVGTSAPSDTSSVWFDTSGV